MADNLTVNIAAGGTADMRTHDRGAKHYPITVPIRKGTTDYDSGVVEVTGTLTSVTGTTTYPEGAYVTNYTAAVHWFTLSNGSSVELISQFPIAPRMTIALGPLLAGATITGGFKVQADAASAVRVQLWGTQ